MKKKASAHSLAESLDRIDIQVQALVRNLVIPPELLDDPGNFAPRRFGLHSQFEEDGIALSLHAVAGARTRRFVEIGCGSNGGNSGILAAELGWKGMMVDANAKAVARTTLLNPQSITGVASWVTRDNIDNLITENGFAGEVDQLGIDVDGNDYWILERLTACRTRVLVLEYNSAFGPSAKVTVPYAEDFTRPLTDELSRTYFGASLSALESLARTQGYGLVAVEPQGANAFFLADGLAEHIPRRRPEEVYRTLPKHLATAFDDDLFRRFEEACLPLVTVGEPSSQEVARPRISGAPRPVPVSRSDYFAEAAGNTELLGVETRFGTFVVSPQDQTIGRSLFTRGKRGDVSMLDHAVKLLTSAEHVRRPVFVDCGANIGTTTVAALRGNGFERAVALEPEPSTFRLLKANLALNDLDERVITKQVAVSAVAETPLELSVHPTNGGGHELVSATTPPPGETPRATTTVSVQSTTIDGLIEDGTIVAEEVGMLWVSVQGHEGAVLAGAQRVLAAGAPVVLAFSPAMLERAGGLDDVYSLSQEHYAAFIDLRMVNRAADGELEAPRRPIGELRELGADLASEEERRYADVLLIP